MLKWINPLLNASCLDGFVKTMGANLDLKQITAWFLKKTHLVSLYFRRSNTLSATLENNSKLIPSMKPNSLQSLWQKPKVSPTKSTGSGFISSESEKRWNFCPKELISAKKAIVLEALRLLEHIFKSGFSTSHQMKRLKWEVSSLPYPMVGSRKVASCNNTASRNEKIENL